MDRLVQNKMQYRFIEEGQKTKARNLKERAELAKQKEKEEEERKQAKIAAYLEESEEKEEKQEEDDPFAEEDRMNLDDESLQTSVYMEDSDEEDMLDKRDKLK